MGTEEALRAMVAALCAASSTAETEVDIVACDADAAVDKEAGRAVANDAENWDLVPVDAE